MKKISKVLLLLAFIVLMIIVVKAFFKIVKPRRFFQESPPASLPDTTSDTGYGIPVSISNPAFESYCDQTFVLIDRAKILDESSQFTSAHLDKVRSCPNTKAMVLLQGEILERHGLSKYILNDDEKGIDLSKFEQRIKIFKDLIDPYIADGTIMAHFTIDEPHDCQDWGGKCPTAKDVDQAGRISKKYWPSMKVLVNTIPQFASSYQWQYTNIINFQYAYHKGSLDQYVQSAVQVLEKGKIDEMSWSIMASQGGGTSYGQKPMSAQQVLETGKVMCDTGEGIGVGLMISQKLIDSKMQQVIDELTDYCVK